MSERLPVKCPVCGSSDPEDFDRKIAGHFVTILCYVCGFHDLVPAESRDVGNGVPWLMGLALARAVTERGPPRNPIAFADADAPHRRGDLTRPQRAGNASNGYGKATGRAC